MFKSQFLHFHRDIFSVSQFPIGKADYNSRSYALTRVGFAICKLRQGEGTACAKATGGAVAQGRGGKRKLTGGDGLSCQEPDAQVRGKRRMAAE